MEKRMLRLWPACSPDHLFIKEKDKKKDFIAWIFICCPYCMSVAELDGALVITPCHSLELHSHVPRPTSHVPRRVSVWPRLWTIRFGSLLRLGLPSIAFYRKENLQPLRNLRRLPGCATEQRVDERSLVGWSYVHGISYACMLLVLMLSILICFSNGKKIKNVKETPAIFVLVKDKMFVEPCGSADHVLMI